MIDIDNHDDLGYKGEVSLPLSREHLFGSCIRLLCLPKHVPLRVPYPSLHKLEGRVTYGVLVGLGLFYYKWNPTFASLVNELFILSFLLCQPNET